MRAKKSLGQHFLKSQKALSTIIDGGKISQSDTILEIGPGTGILTERLLQTGAKVIAIEKDDQLFENLKEKFQKEILSGQINLVHEDILDFQISLPQSYKLIANIPYNITGAILKKFLSTNNQPQLMVLLVQKEVAERICGHLVSTGKGKESILSISVRVYGKPRYVETVKAGSFVPAPKVDSAIISIDSISKGFFTGFSETAFFKMLNAGFRSKRKKFSSNLAAIFEKNGVEEVFRELDLDINSRAEDINLEIWQKLAKKLLTSG